MSKASSRHKDPVVEAKRRANKRAQDQQDLNAADLLHMTDLDRQIWQEELEDFVPDRLFDMHTHLSRAEFNLGTPSTSDDPSAIADERGSLELLNAVEAILSPGRQVGHLLMPHPYKQCAFTAANDFIAAEAKKKPGTRALMVVHPAMTADEVEEKVIAHRFVGFKPYYWYSPTMFDARIPEFMVEHQIAVANRYGLIIGMHMSKRRATADPDNLDDLERLSEKYPRVKWILYHNARSYSSWAMEKAALRLSRLHNIWIESSTVCESTAFDVTFSTMPMNRVLYGTDDLCFGMVRGRYVAWGYAWKCINPYNQGLAPAHCDGRMTFVRYEMLRAMRRAALNQRLTKQQIKDLFWNNAESLLRQTWQDLNDAAG